VRMYRESTAPPFGRDLTLMLEAQKKKRNAMRQR
jgi:hypothetical protein